MSNPANAQNPYGPPTQLGAPAGYPEQAVRSSPAGDRNVLREILFGGTLVVVLAVISSLLSILGSWMYSFQPDMILSLFWTVSLAVVFVVGAGVSALFLVPFATATSNADLVRKVAIAGAVGAAALLLLGFIFSVVTAGQYLVQSILSSGILGSISSGISYAAFFALGVFMARALPPAPRAGGEQGHLAQQQAPQGHPQPQVPQGYAQPEAPQGSAAAQGYQPQGYPQSAVAPQGYQPQAPDAGGQPPVPLNPSATPRG